MVRLQDIAEIVGCSRTTVSNVIHGKTKKVSQETIDKIKKVMDELNYTPNLMTMEADKAVTKNIGVIIYEEIHGINSMQDTFVGELLAAINSEIVKKGYHMVVFNSNECKKIIDNISAWNIDGIIILGYTKEEYYKLKKSVNKKIVLVDTYLDDERTYFNIGIDDYSGGYQVGKYLYEQGYKKALFLSEMDRGSDLHRWRGFKDAMEVAGELCDNDRYVLIEKLKSAREKQYKKLRSRFVEAKALVFSSDFNAIEAISFLKDEGYKIPEDISIVGFDDNIYASFVQPKLTTVRQDVSEKGKIAATMLLDLIEGKVIKETIIRLDTQLIIRESVGMQTKCVKCTKNE